MALKLEDDSQQPEASLSPETSAGLATFYMQADRQGGVDGSPATPGKRSSVQGWQASQGATGGRRAVLGGDATSSSGSGFGSSASWIKRRIQLVVEQVDDDALAIESAAFVRLTRFVRFTSSAANSIHLASPPQVPSEPARFLSVRRVLPRRALIVMVELPADRTLSVVCGRGERLLARLDLGVYVSGIVDAVVLSRVVIAKTVTAGRDNTVLGSLKRAVGPNNSAQAASLPRAQLTGCHYAVGVTTSAMIYESLQGFAEWHQQQVKDLLAQELEHKLTSLSSTAAARQIYNNSGASGGPRDESDRHVQIAAADAEQGVDRRPNVTALLASAAASAKAAASAAAASGMGRGGSMQQLEVRQVAVTSLVPNHAGFLLQKRLAAGAVSFKSQAGWERRWFQLCKPLVLVFQSKGDVKPSEVLYLWDCQVTAVTDDLGLVVEASQDASTSTGTSLLLQASNDHDLEQWVRAFGRIVQHRSSIGARDAPPRRSSVSSLGLTRGTSLRRGSTFRP